jgi:hypothetical protein
MTKMFKSLLRTVGVPEGSDDRTESRTGFNKKDRGTGRGSAELQSLE